MMAISYGQISVSGGNGDPRALSDNLNILQAQGKRDISVTGDAQNGWIIKYSQEVVDEPPKPIIVVSEGPSQPSNLPIKRDYVLSRNAIDSQTKYLRDTGADVGKIYSEDGGQTYYIEYTRYSQPSQEQLDAAQAIVDAQVQRERIIAAPYFESVEKQSGKGNLRVGDYLNVDTGLGHTEQKIIKQNETGELYYDVPSFVPIIPLGPPKPVETVDLGTDQLFPTFTKAADQNPLSGLNLGLGPLNPQFYPMLGSPEMVTASATASQNPVNVFASLNQSSVTQLAEESRLANSMALENNLGLQIAQFLSPQDPFGFATIGAVVGGKLTGKSDTKIAEDVLGIKTSFIRENIRAANAKETPTESFQRGALGIGPSAALTFGTAGLGAMGGVVAKATNVGFLGLTGLQAYETYKKPTSENIGNLALMGGAYGAAFIVPKAIKGVTTLKDIIGTKTTKYSVTQSAGLGVTTSLVDYGGTLKSTEAGFFKTQVIKKNIFGKKVFEFDTGIKSMTLSAPINDISIISRTVGVARTVGKVGGKTVKQDLGFGLSGMLTKEGVPKGFDFMGTSYGKVFSTKAPLYEIGGKYLSRSLGQTQEAELFISGGVTALKKVKGKAISNVDLSGQIFRTAKGPVKEVSKDFSFDDLNFGGVKKRVVVKKNQIAAQNIQIFKPVAKLQALKSVKAIDIGNIPKGKTSGTFLKQSKSTSDPLVKMLNFAKTSYDKAYTSTGNVKYGVLGVSTGGMIRNWSGEFVPAKVNRSGSVGMFLDATMLSNREENSIKGWVNTNFGGKSGSLPNTGTIPKIINIPAVGTSSTSRSVQEIKPIQIPMQLPGQGQTQKQQQRQKQKTLQRTRQDLIQGQLFRQFGFSGFGFPVTKNLTTGIPFIGFGTGGLGNIGKKQKKKGKGRHYQYSPQIAAILGGITSPKIPNTITGLVFRPVIVAPRPRIIQKPKPVPRRFRRLPRRRIIRRRFVRRRK